MLAMLRDAQHSTFCLKGDKAEPSVLRAVDLVSWQVDIHDVPEVLEVVLCEHRFCLQQPLTMGACLDKTHQAAEGQHTCIHRALSEKGLVP